MVRYSKGRFRVNVAYTANLHLSTKKLDYVNTKPIFDEFWYLGQAFGPLAWVWLIFGIMWLTLGPAIDHFRADIPIIYPHSNAYSILWPYALCVMHYAHIYSGNDNGSSKKLCIIKIMHYYVMHYEQVYCITLVLNPNTGMNARD